MRGYQAIANALESEGVGHVFAVAGDDNMALLTELNVSKRVGVVLARKESGAAGMADGYARVTGRPGICTVTSGPGLTNTATTLTTARLHRSPVICITTELPVLDWTGIKGGLDQRRFVETTAGKYIAVRHAKTLGADIRLAFQHVRLGGGPVVLAVPAEIMGGELGTEWEYAASTATAIAPQRAYPDPGMIAKATDILRTSQRPVILAGRGAFESGAEEEIKALAQRTGAILATTLMARGYLTDHPFNVGTAGIHATDAVRSLLADCDCVVAVGCSLNAFTTALGSLFAAAQIIHIDRDPKQIGKTTPIALGIVGDARASLGALNAELEKRCFTSERKLWHDQVKAKLVAARPQTTYAESPDSIDPRQLVAEMDKILPKERILAMDVGHCQFFVENSVSIPDPSHYVRTLDFGSVGMGLYQGIGAAIGRPDRHVVVFTGDGGFMMTLEELDTAVRMRISMTVVIMNDSGFGMEVHLLRAQGKPADVTLYNNPDFVPVAKALGAEALAVRSLSDLQAVASKVGKGDRPLVVDARVNPAVIHDVYSGMMAKLGLTGKHT
ncbi:MAG: thiamine pyrophosphate-binding protein [Sterolibacterium sp.]|nr:thiamine pyrophosphate-binding protein [Sterolibacterium sp.]